MKFLCLILCQREVCTNDDADADTNNDANDNDRHCMIVQGSLVDKPNEPKTTFRVYPNVVRDLSEPTQYYLTFRNVGPFYLHKGTVVFQ